ncbi:MAG: hypothetical protein Q7S46_10150 [Gallionella sp.]|nr:hypothetical protein [Gallionella sp.]
MKIRLHPHALERIEERGATENEVHAAIESGENFLSIACDADVHTQLNKLKFTLLKKRRKTGL